MRDINGHYTIYFNNRYKRVGHLFQGRYKAILVDKDKYLLELSRYLHLNPVRAGIVKIPEKYEFSSMSQYIGQEAAKKWLKTDFVLSQFGDGIKNQVAYRDFVYEGINIKETWQDKVYAGSILGSDTFIQQMTKSYLKKSRISHEVPKVKTLQYGINLQVIEKAITAYYDIAHSSLVKRKKARNNAKKIFVYLARTYTDATLKDIRKYLGENIAEVSISKIHSRLKEMLSHDKQLCTDVSSVTNLILNN
jgi:hypothetical protein